MAFLLSVRQSNSFGYPQYVENAQGDVSCARLRSIAIWTVLEPGADLRQWLISELGAVERSYNEKSILMSPKAAQVIKPEGECAGAAVRISSYAGGTAHYRLVYDRDDDEAEPAPPPCVSHVFNF